MAAAAGDEGCAGGVVLEQPGTRAAMACGNATRISRRFHSSFSSSFAVVAAVVVVSSAVFSASSASAATLWSDVNALHELQQGWNLTPRLSQNWTWGSDPCSDQWIGVSCLQETVISLRLGGCGVTGTLAPAIGKLRNLLHLDLQNNPRLFGRIPNEIGNLNQLSTLDLSNCSFSGTMPLSLGKLRNATYINLKRNELIGEIPFTIGYLSQAAEIHLAHNYLSGTIPVSSPTGFPSPVGVNNLTSLRIFDLSSNSFVGDPPQILLRLPLVSNLSLSLNQFSGVLDGGGRTSGRVHVELINNNITEVTNFPNPFVDPKLGGNPVCADQTFPYADLCGFAADRRGPTKWQQATSCSRCSRTDATVHPATCDCSYPYIGNMVFAWADTRGLEGARIGQLRRALASALANAATVETRDVWIGDAATGAVPDQLAATVLVYPRPPALLWAKSQATFLEQQLATTSAELRVFEPYELVSSNLGTTPLTDGMKESAPVTPARTNHQSTPIIAGVIGGFVSAVLAVGLLICFIKRKRTPDNVDNMSEIFDLNLSDIPPCLFSYGELKASTRNFHRGNKIGEGTFGAVYKGTMRDGSEVAVKELPSNIKTCNQDFINEVEMIAVLQHKNLVKLRGCGIRSNSRLLVYEYAENNSLAQSLFGQKALLLEWPIRYNIAVGMAKGLAYLHSRGPTRLAHGDMKASNILLDRYMEPKIADFGLARLCQNNARKVLTRIEGKRGYVAPEHARFGQLTPKADVFSFGIIALELVSGRESMNRKLPAEEQYLLAWAWNLYEQNRVLDLVDPKVRDGCNASAEALVLIKVALLCSQGEASARPHMVRVVALLTGDADVPDIPQRPEFLGLGLTTNQAPTKDKPRGTAARLAQHGNN